MALDPHGERKACEGPSVEYALSMLSDAFGLSSASGPTTA